MPGLSVPDALLDTVACTSSVALGLMVPELLAAIVRDTVASPPG
jgi:hypothetical protein